MQIRKTYREINPELLYDEIKDFVQKQGAAVAETKMENYSMPTDSSSFIARGTLVFKTSSDGGKECVRAHILGSAKTEVKLMLDIDDRLFPSEKVDALKDDLEFVFGSYELKPESSPD